MGEANDTATPVRTCCLDFRLKLFIRACVINQEWMTLGLKYRNLSLKLIVEFLPCHVEILHILTMCHSAQVEEKFINFLRQEPMKGHAFGRVTERKNCRVRLGDTKHGFPGLSTSAQCHGVYFSAMSFVPAG
ncbi:hypothetical protein HAX54_021919 [Datura stramonium]|uniref:Uncharacterized protein n=1 Tax=Datura stramonium TaxID=4076 RepID=A0ABS8UVT4_DATST|nr:hypothetical protein [Datura stramonium]